MKINPYQPGFFLSIALFFAFFWISPARGADLRVSLLLEHGENAPWTTLLKDGLEQAAREYNLQARVVIAPAGAGQAGIFRSAAEDSDLVLVSGESLRETLRDNASRFRRVKFGCVDAAVRASNIMCVNFADQEAAFLAGVVAALATRQTSVPGINSQNVLGWLAGMDTPAMRTLYNGFQEGARFVNPEVKIAQAVVGSFTDPETAAKKTRALIEAGADIIVLAAGVGNPAAANILEENSVWRIDVDKAVAAPRSLCALVKKADQAIYEIIAAFAKGQFQGKEIIVYDLKNGGVSLEGLAEFPKAAHGKADDIARRVRELAHELSSGNIRIKSLRTRTLCDCLD